MFEIPGANESTDRILSMTRWISGLLVIPLTIAFIILYFFPGNTDRLFAWPIQPALTNIIVGAGYFSGAFFFGRLFLGRKWHHFGLPFLSVTTFATTMAIATIIHWGNFDHSHPTTFSWVFLYAVTPVIVPALWFINKRTDPGTPDADDAVVPRYARLAMAGAGIGALVAAAVLFLWPSVAIDNWAWQLSPLTSRVLGGWYAFGGVAGLTLATDARWSAWRIPMQGALVWTVLMLVGVLRYWNDLDWSTAMAPVFITTLTLWSILLLLFYFNLEFRLRRKGEIASESESATLDG